MNFKEPPYSLEAEQSVLGSMLIDKDAVLGYISELEPEYFYGQINAYIFDVIKSLFISNVSVDLITVKQKLEDRGKLKLIGGISALTELAEIVPTTNNISDYVSIIKDKFSKRELLKGLNYAYDGLNKDLTQEEILKALEENIRRAQSFSPKKDIAPITTLVTSRLNDLMNSLDVPDIIKGVNTGIAKLDKLLGPMGPGNLIYIGARPSMGKTAFALNIANHNIKEGKNVAFFSMEMSGDELVDRFISMNTSINSFIMKTWTTRPEGITEKEFIEKREQDIAKISEGVDYLVDKDLHIDTSQRLTPQKLRSKLAMLSMKKQLDLVIVDYIGLMSSDKKGLSKVAEQGDISRELKMLAIEFDVPIICLAQLSRSLETRLNKRPIMSDLRDSGSLEQDANVILFLYNDLVYNEFGDKWSEINIAKNRSGQASRNTISYVEFNKSNGIFSDYQPDIL